MDNPLQIQGRDTKYGASLTLLQPIYTGGRHLKVSAWHSINTLLLRTRKNNFYPKSVFRRIFNTGIPSPARKLWVSSQITEFIAALTQTIRERVEISLVNPQDLLMAEVKLNDAEFQLLQAKKELRYRTYGLQFPSSDYLWKSLHL